MAATDTMTRLGMRSVPLAWRNLVVNKARLARSSAGIAFAVLLMLVQLGFERGFFDASLAAVRQLDGDLFIMSGSRYRVMNHDPFPHRYVTTAAGVAGVAAANPLYGAWTDFFWKDPTGPQTYLVQAFAFDPEYPPFLLPDVQAESTRLKDEDTVLVDRRGRDFLHMAGDAIQTEINGHAVHIVGHFSLGPDFMSDGTVMMSERTYARLLPGNHEAPATLPVDLGVIKLKPGEDPSHVAEALRAALPPGMRVLSKTDLVAYERRFQADLSSAGPIFLMGTVVGFVVGMLISYQIIYTDLSDQLPQYATLKGMGYGTSYLVRVVMEQATLSALAGYIPAWLLCLAVYWVIGTIALLPLHMTFGLTLLSLALTVGMCLISAALAIRRVIRADPAEVF